MSKCSRDLAKLFAALNSCHSRRFSTQNYASTHEVPLDIPTFSIWAPNTGVGKTLVSAGLARTAARAGDAVCFIKPVQTGFPEDSDARLVAKATDSTHHIAPYHAAAYPSAPVHVGFTGTGAQSGATHPVTLFAWSRPVSPHLAVESEGRPVGDAQLAAAVSEHLLDFARFAAHSGRTQRRMALVETAGGVCSPAPSGTLQVDALRALRLPAVLVSDGRLGGISATLSAYDSLLMRGYDVVAVAGMDSSGLDNARALRRHLRGGPHAPPPVITLPTCAPPAGECKPDEVDPEMAAWLDEAAAPLSELHAHMHEWHTERVQRLREMPAAARAKIWWPFTQHRNVREADVTVIDARHGEHFLVAKTDRAGTAPNSAAASGSAVSGPRLEGLYDACASWWTQGVTAELQPLVTKSLAYGAGRYVHAIFPENVHEPALQLTERLLDGPGKGWAARAFFTDDGSTAVEVALKMAFRKYAVDHGEDPLQVPTSERRVLALQNAYHGDTLGAMDCGEPSVFNQGQTPWYRARALFLDPPTCGITHGRWEVRPPSGTCPSTQRLSFASADELFSEDRLRSDTATHYSKVICAAVDEAESTGDARMAACLMEPVLQGAGGMVLVDPLFQKVLVQVCKERNIPVIADEVFTGLWRLGRVSAMSLLNARPDIACYAKLLTAGTIPLSVTMASEDVFNAFDGDTKAEALLHGHSYTAHPIGCQVANAALEVLGSSEFNPNMQADGRMRDVWNAGRVDKLSAHPAVERVVCLGTVLAAELKVAEGEGGYSSNVARKVTNRMRGHGLYARPLGNVVYLMCTPTSPPETTDRLLDVLELCL